MKKIKFMDHRVRKVFLRFLGVISTFLSLVLIFIEIPDYCKLYLGILFGVILVITYIGIWVYANMKASASLKIGGTTVEIIRGDIFTQDGLKVIPFNDYFDTIVDNKIIAERSLHGQFIQRKYEDPADLKRKIEGDVNLNKEENFTEVQRYPGFFQKKYNLGSTFVDGDFVLTAFSKFNEENEARLSMSEYINFLLIFWNEINRVYAQKSVSVPLFGAGITRFSNGFNSIPINELLNIMLWTFRISETRFKYPAKLRIIIYKDQFDEIDLFGLKGEINDGSL